MILLDVNVLVHAHREDTPSHDAYRQYIEAAQLAAASPFGVSELVLSGFLRVVTHPKVFRVPTPLPIALEFAGAIRSSPTVSCSHAGRATGNSSPSSARRRTPLAT